MRCLVLLMLLYALDYGETESINLEKLEGFYIDDSQINASTIVLLNNLVQELEDIDGRYGGIITIMNDYADKVFTNVQKLILRNSLDPVKLPDQVLKLFPTGTISLSEGWLEDMSTIARYKNVSISYSSFAKKLTLVVPIQFNALMSIYKYHTKIFILNLYGDVQGKIADLRANIKLSFDFRNYEASLDTFDIKDSGSISLTFSGHGLLDWITTRMTAAVTYFLQPVIIRIIELIVKGGLETTVTAINGAIDDVLHNSTTLMVTSENYLYI